MLSEYLAVGAINHDEPSSEVDGDAIPMLYADSVEYTVSILSIWPFGYQLSLAKPPCECVPGVVCGVSLGRV